MGEIMQRRWELWFGIILSLMFLVVASIPGTIALRYSLLVALLTFVVFCRRKTLLLLWYECRWPAGLLILFVGYAALHCWLMASWPEYAWKEFKSQIVVGAFWFSVGWGVFRSLPGLSIFRQAVIAGSLLAFTEFLIEAWKWYQDGSWPFMVSFVTSGHLEFTFIMNLVLAFVLVALFFNHQRYQLSGRLPVWLLWLILLLIVFVSFRSAARNGMIGLFYLVLSLTFVYSIFEYRRLRIRGILVLSLLMLLILTVFGAYAFKQDVRNEVLMDSLEAGWNYSSSTAWFDRGVLPILHNGKEADDSAYKRLAWFHRGLDLIAEHPLGYGYGRNAFGKVVDRTLSHEGSTSAHFSTHSHSGFIDLGIGLGVPGLLLWYAFCGSLIVVGFRAFMIRGELLGLILILISTGFIARMMIDSIQRDHMLQLFLFITAGMLAELSVRHKILADGRLEKP